MPIMHTDQCQEAQLCGHHKAHCICTYHERRHADWEAFQEVYNIALRDGRFSAVTKSTMERARIALDTLHQSIAARINEERDKIQQQRCDYCREMEDGP